MDRRRFLATGGVLLAGLLPCARAGGGPVVEIRLVLDADTGFVGFDPVGAQIEPGTRVRWVNGGGVHTVTAYHPDNDGHPLRIPSAAEPWDSGYLVEPGATFTRRLTVPGVYDYFCAPHERAGMVGRLVVGTATGPGARPFDGSRDRGRDWRRVPAAARRRLPPAMAVVERGRIAGR